jgi:23S rRNA pseudouridine1911/1915/1917 synthase
VKTLVFTVKEQDAGKRTDVFLSQHMENTSRNGAALLAEKGAVSSSGKLLKKSDKVTAGMEITVCLPDPVSTEVLPADIPLDVVYEDDELLVINKSKGMVVHPGAGNWEDTLVNALLHHCKGRLSGINGVLRPGIVHRLDKDTTGLIVAAKTDRAHRGLTEQLQQRTMRRGYEAIVFGAPKNTTGTINLPIGRHPKDRKKMAVIEQGRPAVTHYEVIASYAGYGVTYSHMALQLETGRTHQIRVHMSRIGHPVAGDPVYGALERDRRYFPWLESQCLHAKRLAFVHPITGVLLELEAPLPADFVEVLTKLSLFGKMNDK